MASSADSDVRPRRSTKTCNKCQGPVRGHVGPRGDLCRNPSPQFLLGDAPELANIQHDLEESIRVHQQQINSLTSELQLLNMGSSTPCSDVLPSQHPAQGQGDFHPPLSSFRPNIIRTTLHTVTLLWAWSSFSSASGFFSSLVSTAFCCSTGLIFAPYSTRATKFSKQE